MKKITGQRLFRSIFAVCLLCLASTASAYDFYAVNNGDTIYYYITSSEDLTCKVTCGDDLYSGKVVIPSTAAYGNNTYSVTSIGSDAFYDCADLISIEIPSSVTSIGDGAFVNCTGLTSIEIPSSVTSLGGYAFYGCTSLTSIEIPSSVTSIGESIFNYCASLISINVDEDNTVYSSLDGILYNKDKTELIQCPGAKTAVNIPSSVTSIGGSAFYSCSNITSIEIPSSVTSLGEFAFFGCTSLTSIEIPSSVTFIGESIFNYCASLISINVDKDNTVYSSLDGILYNKDKTELIRCSGAKTAVNIPSSVTSIKNFAFEDCSNITSIEISSSVTSIDDYAFYGCSNLTSFNVDKSNPVFSSEDSILYNKDKTKLVKCPAKKTTVNIPTSVTSIGIAAFSYCTSLTSIEIPSSVTSIGKWAFLDCTGFTSFEIPSSVTTIEEGTFFECTSLTSIEIPNSVTSIGCAAFQQCTSLTSIKIPSSATSIEDEAFYLCTSLTSIEIPSSVTSIGYAAFWGCTSLKTIEVPPFVTFIGNRSCYHCEEIYFTSTFVPTDWSGRYPSNDDAKVYVPIGQKDLYVENSAVSNSIGYIPLASTISPMTVEGYDDGYWGTIYTTGAVSVPDNVSVYALSAVSEDGSKGALTKVAEAGCVIPAGAYIISTADSIKRNLFIESDSTAIEISTANLLAGIEVDSLITNNDSLFYVFSDSTENETGFFALASEDGHSINAQAYKAFLPLSGNSETKSITLMSDEAYAGIKEIGGSKTGSGRTYSPQGIEVKDATNGIYIRDGKKILVNKISIR